MDRRLHRAERVAILVALALILGIAFWPSRVDGPVDGHLERLLAEWHKDGVPMFVDYAFIEAGANVLLFVPLGALIASVTIPRLWWSSAVLGLALSLTIECGQALFLPARVASVTDLVTNTSGALLGGAVVAVIRVVRSGALASQI